MEWRERLRDPRFFSEGCLPAHSDHQSLFPGEREQRTMLLDGTWRFHICTDIAERLDGFQQEDFSVDGMQEIQVPAHINLAGWGDPEYTNTAYPWDGREQLQPGMLPRHIPTAQYVRQFTVPESWLHQTLRLRMEGVEPAFRVFCNGTYLGYREDSFTPSEFDLTGLLHPGENRLAVEVYRWASGSWLEDQDFWRFWGIFRSVKVLCLPKTQIEDLQITADMEGRLRVQLAVSGSADRVVAHLTAPDGVRTGDYEAPVRDGTAAFCEMVQDPLLWSAEKPNLYDLSFSVLEGELVAAECRQLVGFRTVAIEDGILKCNGKRLLLHGVNRHEWSAQHGRVITVEEMEQDARMMKRANINAVRTSHYPNRSEWYDICDKIGLYVVDEVNLETHGTWSGKAEKPENCLPLLPDDRPEWKEAVLDRARNMQQRDKNHPSIILWSCGNESRGGETIWEMSELLRHGDGTRPIHYESVCYDPRYPDTTDLLSTMYFSPEQAEQYLLDHPGKPYIQVEYAHAMGNSCGDLESYVELEERYPRYQGGFIWDWIDQQLWKDGQLHYGGDFRGWPNSGDFSADGLLFADRTPSPKLAAVKAAYSPVAIEFVQGGITVYNKMRFTDLSEVSLSCSVCTKDGVYAQEERTVSCPPGERRLIRWEPGLPETGEVWGDVSVRTAQECQWCEAGYELCFAQHPIRSRAAAESGWQMVDGSEYLGFTSGRLCAAFQKGTGLLCSIRVDGREWMSRPIRPAFWRAPVSNDAASAWPFEKSMWKGAELYPKKERFTMYEDGEAFLVETVFQLPTQPKIPYTVRYSFQSGGRLKAELDCQLPEGMEPPFVFGIQLATWGENNQIRYDGLGPQETAADRLSGSRRGTWTIDAHRDLTPYMTPQDCALRFGTRSLSCGGLQFEGEHPFAFSALPWSSHELECASHAAELPQSNQVFLRLLSDSCGVGGDDTWGARPHAAYRLAKNVFHFGVTLTAEIERDGEA